MLVGLTLRSAVVRRLLVGFCLCGPLAACSPPSPEELRLLAEQGQAGAQFSLGSMYIDGVHVPRDYAEAARWYRLAADQGHDGAQFSLGVMYYTGRYYTDQQGVAQDYGEAARWYRLAADQGHDGAQFSLGVMYMAGQGVSQDHIAAHMWLSLAVARVSARDRAKYVDERDELAAKMTSGQIAEAQRLAGEWKPIDQR